MTCVSSDTSELESKLLDLRKYIAVGCLHFDHEIQLATSSSHNRWAELVSSDMPSELRTFIGNEAARLLDARWVRMFALRTNEVPNDSLVRVYLLPEDWGRRYIDRNSRSLRTALRTLLLRIDVSPEAWAGAPSATTRSQFDPWASAEDASLFYLFNKLPSPAPAPEEIKTRHSRRAVEDLLDSVAFDPTDKAEELPLPGLKSRLYPYQARSASLMIQREAAPELQLDPRFDVRQSPNGERFYFGAKDGSFVKEPKFYEANRGGILAETMVSLSRSSLVRTCVSALDEDTTVDSEFM